MVAITLALELATGCSGTGGGNQSARQPIDPSLHMRRLLVPARPPVVAAELPEDLAVAALAAARAEPSQLVRDELSQWVGIDALPLLTSTEAGRRFLAAAPPRALARGTPPELCPAMTVATAPKAAPPASAEAARAEVAEAALATCLDRASATPGCGCRVIALDDMVTVPREEVAYATGTTARLRVASLGLDLILVAEDGPEGGTLLRGLTGTVAQIARGADDTVSLTLEGGARMFRGRSIPVGFRRGRLAERIYAEDGDGNRLSLLIGFAPDELAQSAGAWLAWPNGG